MHFSLFMKSIVLSFFSTVLSQSILLPLPLNEKERNLSHDAAVIFSEPVSLVILNSEYKYSTLLRYLSQSSQDNCNEVIGIVGDVGTETAGIINTLAKGFNSSIALISAVSPTTFGFQVNDNLPPSSNMLDMNPVSHYAQAVINYTNHLNWTRIGLISDSTNYYQLAAQLLQEAMHQSERTFTPLVMLNGNSSIRQSLQTIFEFRTQIVIISTNRQTACLLLKEALNMELIWPTYGWLVLDYGTGADIETTCKHEGVITIKDFSVKEAGTQRSFSENIFLDSFTALALARQDGVEVSNVSFTGRTGFVEFRKGNRLNNISIVQVRNRSQVGIAQYNSDTQELAIQLNILEFDSPRGTILTIRQENTVGHTIFFALLVTFCYAFVTITFVLYILFRNETEIKATSVPVSISMFLACYLLLSLVPVLLVKAYPDSRVSVPHSATCHFIGWLGGTGIPVPLILSIIMVKMLRVYAIILKPLSYRKKFFTDSALLLYVILLMFPSVLILTLWSSIDPLVIVDFPVASTENKVIIIEVCLSRHINVWVSIPYVYTGVLCIAVMIAVLKTSRVRYKYFKDTNSTNIFAFVTIVTAITGTAFGYIFSVLQASPRNYLFAEMSVSISVIGIAMSCQAFLFVPKVYPPLKRWIHRNEVRKK